MAWIRCCGGATKKIPTLYDSGTWNVPYDNNGGYTWSSNYQKACTLNSDNVSVLGDNGYIAIIGTSNKIDFTGYTKLKVLVNGTNVYLNTYGTVRVSQQKSSINTNTQRYVGVTSAGTNTYEIDISGITEGYVSVDSGTGFGGCKLYKIWLE